jgi:hypothetical protein
MKLRAVLAPFLLAGTVLAQAPAKPGPEVKKLDFFVGTWKGEGIIPPGPWGAAGKYTVTLTNEWMDGNFFLIGHAESKMPPGLGAIAFRLGSRATTPTRKRISSPSTITKAVTELRMAV